MTRLCQRVIEHMSLSPAICRLYGEAFASGDKRGCRYGVGGSGRGVLMPLLRSRQRILSRIVPNNCPQ